ncbi:MAG: M28 family peptidase [bacterium]
MSINPLTVMKELDFERITGTAGERRARRILAGYLTRLKVAHREHSFRIRTSDRGQATLRIGGKTIPVHPFGLCGRLDLSAPLVFVENLDLLHYTPGRHTGRLVMFYESSLPLREIKTTNRLAGLIRIGRPDQPPTSYNLPQREFKGVPTVPMVSIAYADAESLIPLSGHRARLTVSQRTHITRAANLVASIPGSEPDGTLTYAVAHYDCPAGTNGASDNGAGTVNLLSVAEYFARNPPKRDLTCIFCSGEELGLKGSSSYVRDHLKEVRTRGRLAINLDLSGEPIGQNVFMVTGTPELKGYVGAVAREDGFLFKETLDIYSSDNMPFAYEEVPAVSIARIGGRAGARIHSALDRVENLSRAGLEQTSGAAIAILRRVLNARIYPIRREIDPSLREKVEKYQYNSTREKPDLHWRAAYEK